LVQKVIEKKINLGVIMHTPSRLYVEAEKEDNSTVGPIRRKIVKSKIQYYGCTNASLDHS